ncbi:MAG: tetratricopeptide repeat protein [Candidatus Cloacimonetes bacterium]|nr:tetratricopeptide repeat protein [Candidatus Cloacimonadota bacterium]
MIIEPEDGHWIDTDSQKLMEVLTRNVEKYPITIISSCRLKDDSSLFDFNLKEVPEKNIILEHLEKDSSRKLVEDILQGKVSDAFFYLIWQKSEGNPFYIEQIILFLLENDLIDVKMNLTERDIKIPKTINSIIVARIDRLTTELKELVQTASVLGREFAVNILSEMLNKKEINKELTEGEDENIWNALTEINYIFKHALIRETVYEMQLKKNLSELHKLAAETIENIYIKDLRLVYGELVNHYEKAEIKTKAIEYLKKAGDYAKEHYQNELAIEFYDRMLDNLQGLANLRSLEIDILLKKGEIMELIGKWKETEKIYRKALILSEEIKDKKRIAKSYGSYGSQQRLKGNYNKAKEFYEKQLEICERLEDKNGISVAVGNMGLVNMDHGKYKKAMDCYIKGLKICEELGNKHGISIVIGNMGILYYFQNSYEKSIECFKKKLKICEKLGDKRGAMIVNGNIGNVYQLQGRYKKAITCHKKQLKSSEELGDIKGISIAVGNIGSVHKDQGIYTKAMECYQQKLKICKKLGDKRGISVSTCRIGIIYENNGNYRKAMEYYIKDLKICEELNDRRGTTRGIGNLGDIYYYQGNYEKAIECYVKLLTISTELGDKNGISVAVGNKGNVYMNQGNYKKAIECYKKAINIKNELGLKQSLIYPLSSKAKCLYKMWEYRKAKECNEKCATVAKELESKKQIFLSAVLKEKINFKLAESFQSRSQNNENLKLLLRDEKEEENIAELNYEIALMLNEMRKDYSKYKNKSISIYKRLYKKTPNIDYKNRIEELEKL